MTSYMYIIDPRPAAGELRRNIRRHDKTLTISYAQCYEALHRALNAGQYVTGHVLGSGLIAVDNDMLEEYYHVVASILLEISPEYQSDQETQAITGFVEDVVYPTLVNYLTYCHQPAKEIEAASSVDKKRHSRHGVRMRQRRSPHLVREWKE